MKMKVFWQSIQFGDRNKLEMLNVEGYVWVAWLSGLPIHCLGMGKSLAYATDSLDFKEKDK